MPLTLPRRDSNEAPRLELDQGWEFLPDFEAKVSIANLPAEGWRAAQVAIGWNAQFDDLRDYLGVGWYRCLVDIPQYSDPRHVLVRFGAVDYFAEVFMNGKLVGSHEGGYTPFVIDATSAVKPGVNELVVRVIDPPMDEPRNLLVCPEMMYHEIPHGKQNWYVQNAGIWQGVRIELAPAIYIETIRVTPHVGGDFRVDVALAGVGLIDQSLTSNTDLSFTVTDRSGRQILADTLPLVSAEMQSFRGTISKPQLWNLHDPALYTLEVRVRGAVSYRKRVRFGFRKFEAKHGKLYLNDQPFYMRGALDQDFYPETIHTPSSEDYVRELMLKAKRLGINILRCHLKIAHPVYLTVADEVGMLLWTEVPSWSDCWYPSDHFSLKAADRGRRMFEEMIERDWNHPSIVIQTIMNESWGIDLNDSTQRTWLKNTFNWVKEELAPIGRLVIDNSACEKNFHMKSDIEDFHNYYSMPDQADRWEKWTTELAARPDWTFSPHGDGERTGEEPIIVSEFGNWGLPQLPEDLPWWFSVNFGEREATRPLGLHKRFEQYGFNKIFGDYDSFAQQTQWHQFASLKHEIEDIRKHGQIQGYVLTGMTDVHWEVNGLLDMWRNPKVFAQELTNLQTENLLLLDISRYNFWAGERRDIPVLLSHYGKVNLQGARLRWMLDSGMGGQLPIEAVGEAGSLDRIGQISVTFPDVAQPTKERLNIELRSKTGALITENTYELYIFPRIDVPKHPSPSSIDDLSDIVKANKVTEDVIVTERLDAETELAISNGRRALIVINSDDALPQGTSLVVKERWGTQYDGRWFSNFNWIKPNPALDPVRLNPIMAFESRDVSPDYVITGIAPADFSAVLVGATFGWVQLNSAIALAVKIGNGIALLTTFKFDKYGDDPFATHLLTALLDHLHRATAQEALDLSSTAQMVNAG